MIQNPLAYVLCVVLLLCFSGSAQPQPKSSTANSYELTVYAGYDGRLLVEDPTNFDGLKIRSLVKAGAPFSFFADDGHGNHLSVSGTVKEIDTRDFSLESAKLEGFDMSAEGLFCNSKETRETRRILEPILGPDSRYDPNDLPEAESSIWWIPIGPGYRLSLKRRNSNSSASDFLIPSGLTIASVGPSVILTWPTNLTGFILQSATKASSSVWATNSSTPDIINGRNTVTNAISGTQQFFRLGH